MNSVNHGPQRVARPWVPFVGWCLLTSALGVPIPASAQSTLSNPPPEEVDALFSEWDRPGSPGCVLGVISDGRLVYEKGYGHANLDWDVPITPSTVFYVGSVSKQFTAAAVALLAREGTISLDDEIQTYFPEMPDYGAPVTVRHLIHHTSGIRDIYALMNLAGHRIEDVFTDEEAIALLASQSALNFDPGEEFLYSNGGYFMLAQLVERVSGMSFREFTEARIFAPLGMDDTHFHDDPGHIVKRRAMSYAPRASGEFEQNYLTNFDKVGQGGLYTTVGDLLEWDRNFYENTVGGEGFTEFLLTPGVLNNGDTLEYAFGLMNTEYKGLRVVDHAGGMMGFRADLLRFPEQRFSVACLCNLGSINPSELTRRVADLYLAEHFRGELEEYEGSYHNGDMEVTYEVRFRGGSLFMDLPWGDSFRLESAGADRFTVSGMFGVGFVRNAQNRVTEMILDAGRARNVRYVRTPGVTG